MVVFVFMLFLPFFTGIVLGYSNFENITIPESVNYIIEDAIAATDFITSHKVTPHCSAIAWAIPGNVLLLIFAVLGSFQLKIFPFSSVA